MNAKERNEISIHQLKFVRVMQSANGGWLSAASIASQAKIGIRTARYYAKYFVDNGLLDLAETFPCHKYKWSELAEKRNKALCTRLAFAAEAMADELAGVSNVVRINASTS